METVENSTSQEGQSNPRSAAWLGLAPFLPWPLFYVLILAISTVTGLDPESYLFDRVLAFALSGALLLYLAALVVGWVQGLPAWSLPYWVFALIAAAYPPAGEVLRFYAQEGLRWELPAWWTLVPVLIVVVVMLALRPSISPLRSLVERVRRDPTLLSFIFYAASPFLLQLAMSGMFYLDVLQIFINGILAVGAWYYLRGQSVTRRMIALLAASAATWVITAFVLEDAWAHPVAPSMRYPFEGLSPLGVTLGIGVGMCVVVAVPWVVLRKRAGEANT